MVTGLAVTAEQTAIVIHAVAAPIIFSLVSLRYFIRHGYATPLKTATTFVSFVIITDFLLVALVIMRSLKMFASPLGTWIPFTLGFIVTYLTGRAVEARRAGTEIKTTVVDSNPTEMRPLVGAGLS